MSHTLDKMTRVELFAAAANLKHLEGYKTLVLNKDYTPFSVIPLSTIGWKDAITGYISDKYDVLKEYEGVVIRSPSLTLSLPSIVVCKEYRSPDLKIPFSKKNIFLRDDYRCQYCGKGFSGASLTFDHVVPRSKGGKTSWTNIVSSCDTCNRSKGNKEYWVSPLGKTSPLNPPYKPNYFDLAKKMRRRKLIIPEGSDWETYINWDGPLYVRNEAGHAYQISGPDSEPIEAEYLGY